MAEYYRFLKWITVPVFTIPRPKIATFVLQGVSSELPHRVALTLTQERQQIRVGPIYR